MDEYIKREDALSVAHKIGKKEYDWGNVSNAAIVMIVEGYLRAVPADDVVERKRGKWIYQFHEDEVGATCSECEGYAESFARWIYDDGYRVTYNFCPNCGADMRGEDDV